MLIRITVFASLVTLAGVWGLSLTLWSQLPASIPLHFNAAGVPDRSGPPTAGNWLLLPVLATAMNILFAAIAWSIPWLARVAPQWINIPNKAAFLIRTPDERVWILEPIAFAFALDAMVLQALFATIAFATERVANGAWATLPVWLPLAFVLPSVALPLIGTVMTVIRTR